MPEYRVSVPEVSKVMAESIAFTIRKHFLLNTPTVKCCGIAGKIGTKDSMQKLSNGSTLPGNKLVYDVVFAINELDFNRIMEIPENQLTDKFGDDEAPFVEKLADNLYCVNVKGAGQTITSSIFKDLVDDHDKVIIQGFEEISLDMRFYFISGVGHIAEDISAALLQRKGVGISSDFDVISFPVHCAPNGTIGYTVNSESDDCEIVFNLEGNITPDDLKMAADKTAKLLKQTFK